jgi:hypothetical protein
LKARPVLRELFCDRIDLRPDADGELWAEYGVQPAALLRAVGNSRSGGVLWTCSIFPLFAPTHLRGAVLPPGRCGNGHELTLDNLVPAERATRWRCRQCGTDRAATWRRKRTTAACYQTRGGGERGGARAVSVYRRD